MIKQQMIKPLSAALAAVALVSLAAFGSIPAAAAKTAGQAPAGRAPAGSTASIVPPGWKLVFTPSFSGSAVNPKVWGTCYPWSPGGCTNFGNPDEVEWYLPSQVKVKSGILQLTAQREPTQGFDSTGAPKTYDCRSGMVTTFPSFRFEYGFVQVTARFPNSTGLWSAIWLAAANEKWPPEIDIVEHWDSSPTLSRVYLHPLNGPRQGAAYKSPTVSKGWHTFDLYWTKSRLSWYYDGRQVFTTTTDIPRQSMYLIANLAVYDDQPGACSGTMLVKSVKVWEPK